MKKLTMHDVQNLKLIKKSNSEHLTNDMLDSLDEFAIFQNMINKDKKRNYMPRVSDTLKVLHEYSESDLDKLC